MEVTGKELDRNLEINWKKFMEETKNGITRNYECGMGRKRGRKETGNI